MWPEGPQSKVASDDRCEGVYIRYMTEQMEEAGAARGEKDK